ncbi:glycoside hydrolase superfamily [Naematelia encephala]|uniref:glucan endo-1,3-beta-D-glucosidase n=1 Tax=Naematelia encephala TaxID=71784 RepID=A0A1Y2BBD9_9TREE|nr:glycoside hydrolase superfamily [Naematelia encephala]
MPIEQRYTPVPGMGREGNMASSSGFMRTSASGFELDNFYDGNVPAPHRLESYSDPFSSRPNSLAQIPSSTSTYRDLPSPPLGASHARSQSSISNMAPMSMAATATPATRDGNLAYQNIPSETYWTSDSPNLRGYSDPTPPARSKKAWYWIGGVALAIIVLVAVVVGVVVGKDRSGKGNNNDAVKSGDTNSTSTLSNSTDPSQFTKDSRLHQSFWAIAYTPQSTLLPWCGAVQANVTRDIQLLSQLTTRLRLYGANCNTTALVLQAIQDTKVNMTIWPAIYVDSNETAYSDQLTAVEAAIKTYGTDHIEGVIVGNEYILDTAGTDSLTDATYLSAVSDITDKVAQVKSDLDNMSLNKTLPVGTSDAGSIMSTTLAEGIDFFMANVHPWFGDVAIQDAATWTYNFFQEFDVEVAAQASNNPATYIAETGWPTAANATAYDNNGVSGSDGDASVANLQTFLDTFICQANNNGTNYFFFEAFDEPWKEEYGGVEPFWGVFDSDRNLKNLTIPTC